jgi:hypothetical protein
LEFTSETRKSKSRDILELDQKGKPFSLNLCIRMPSLENFGQYQGCVLLFQTKSIWTNLENHWILENCKLGPAHVNSAAQPQLELAQGHTNAQPAQPTRSFLLARHRVPKPFRQRCVRPSFQKATAR